MLSERSKMWCFGCEGAQDEIRKGPSPLFYYDSGIPSPARSLLLLDKTAFIRQAKMEAFMQAFNLP